MPVRMASLLVKGSRGHGLREVASYSAVLTVHLLCTLSVMELLGSADVHSASVVGMAVGVVGWLAFARLAGPRWDCWA